MDIIYRALDGKEFTDEKECLRYEQNAFLSYAMFDRDGDETDDPAIAIVVYLPTMQAATRFLFVCDRASISAKGISPSTTGLFVWDPFSHHYCPISPDAARALSVVLPQLLPTIS